MKTVIVIPARYASTRFPGKPLAMLGGMSMLARTVKAANQAAAAIPGTDVLVTTEDTRIADHCESIGVDCEITPPECPTGSDRVLAALQQRGLKPDCVVNLQGDAPFTPPEVLTALMTLMKANPAIDAATPVHTLSWTDLDALRTAKQTNPFTGTTCIRAADGRALWFSKTILPAIRKEDRSQVLSPVFQHIGLYAYRYETLERFVALPPSPYEVMEGLEQLRLLENGMALHTVLVEGDHLQSGIDTPDDLARAEAHLAKHGA